MPLRRVIKLILLTLGGLFALFNMLVLALLIWVFTHPQEAWALVEKRWLPKDLHITWKKLAFEPRRQNLLNWDLHLAVTGLNIAKGSPALTLPIETIDVQLSAQAFAPGFHVQVHDIRVVAPESLKFSIGPDGETPARSYYQMLHTNLNYLTAARRIAILEHLTVEVADFQYLSDGSPALHIGLKAHKPEAKSERIDFDLRVEPLAPPEVQALTFKGAIDMDRFKENDPFLKGDFELTGPAVSLRGPIQLIYTGESASIDTTLDVRYRLGKKWARAHPTAHLSLDERRFQVRADTELEGIPGPVAKLRRIRALLTVPQTDGFEWSSSASTFVLNAPVALFFVDKNMRPPLEKSCACRIPEELVVKVDGQAWLKTYFEPSRERRPLMDTKVSVESVKNKLFSVNAAARLKIDQQGLKREQLFYEPSIDAEILVHSYQGVRKYLDAKNVMIPAPFDTLDGTVDLRVLGPIIMGHEGEKVTSYMTPIELTSALSSKNQKVALSATTGVKIDADFKQLDVNVRARIAELVLELPPLDPILGLPRLARDRRLQLQPPVVKTRAPKFKVTVNFDVETEHPASIRLLSKLASPYIPLSLKVTRLSGSNDGFIRVEPFKIKYLRRTVGVENVQLDLNETSRGDFPIKGRLRVDQTDYRIFIDFTGTTDDPQISLSSEPYLDRDNIISVLLYDRTSQELVGSDSETSGNVQAALADRAIGLFGLWAFATTPIRSFSYNAVTKVYTATVQLADGLTAGVGTDWEHAAHLEVRKRVSKRWVLTASYAPSQDQRDVGQVVLQWEKRF